MSVERLIKDQSREVVNELGKMIMAARSAFNRHSQVHLGEMQTLQGVVAQELADLLKETEAAAAKAAGGEKAALLRLHSIFSRIKIISDNLAALVEPLAKKIKDGVLFSEKAVTQINYLFDQQTGMLHTVADIIITGNAFLIKFLAGEARKLIQSCNDYATEHEARLIEGLCLPQAAPMFLGILERFRGMAQQEVEVAELMGE